ncbi:MAG: transporter substrate-binding domain-containing protein [Pseudomonadota bacterium]
MLRSLRLPVAMAFAVTGGLAPAQDLSFCYDPYPPYTLIDEAGEGAVEGIKVRILEAVLARIEGVSAEVTLLPWQRCQSSVRIGDIDGILPLFANDDRRSYMVFTTDVLEETAVFWFKPARFPDGLPWTGDFAEVARLQLGMLRGGYIDGDMQAAFTAQGGITRGPSVEALFQMLYHGRIDLVATDRWVGEHYRAKLGMQQDLDFAVPPIATKHSQFGLSRVTGADRYLEAFNRAITTLRAEGRIEEIAREIGR